MLEYIAKKMVDAAFKLLTDQISNRIRKDDKEDLNKLKRTERGDDQEKRHFSIRGSTTSTIKAISYHIKQLKNWSTQVNFNDLRESKKTDQIYIELDIYLYPSRVRISPDEKLQAIPLHEIFSRSQNHYVIMGQPGAGKTTSMKHLCGKIIRGGSFYFKNLRFPIVIRFRDLNSPDNISPPCEVCHELGEDRSVIFRRLFQILDMNFFWSGKLARPNCQQERMYYVERAVITMLDELGVLLILDGLDELVSESKRDIAIAEVRKLAVGLSKARMILTSRTGEFNQTIEGCDVFEISPLSEPQIRDFVSKWLGKKDLAESFVTQVKSSPFADTTIRPLSLAHLCAIYERIGKIPDKPKTVYRKVVNLLLEEWDEQRSVTRRSRYAQFEVDRKFEFLSSLAYVLTTKAKTTTFGKQHFVTAYETIYRDFSLPVEETRLVAVELETHTGLFLQTGVDQFDFAHKSLQEYLTAEYIVRLPTVPDKRDLLALLGNELAIAIAISSNPSAYFCELILNRLTKVQLPLTFYQTFVNRLIQERPDCNIYPSVVVSFFTLLTLWLYEGESSMKGPMSKVVNPALVDSYDQFLSMILERNRADVLIKHYQRAGPASHGSLGGLLLLKLKRNSQNYDFPQRLVTFESFLPKNA